ncbi:MAG: PilC/PilY family type IV pilus protein [Desulfocapsaceae bacterium]|nr:PilC/PilY family type IV pilus protein [Desulfocapsaceae bacterium]
MGYGVYEHRVDYGAMYDYLVSLHTADPRHSPYIRDAETYAVRGENFFYGADKHLQANKIYLLRGAIGLTIANVNGRSISFAGDAGDPAYPWMIGGAGQVDTHTLIDAAGNLIDDGTHRQRIIVDPEGFILFDGRRLPGSQDILLKKKRVLPGGFAIDSGFTGMLEAPGYYFSGYRDVGANSSGAVAAVDGDRDIFFFVTGNWINMQTVYNLRYFGNPAPPPGKKVGDPAWMSEEFPLAADIWEQVPFLLADRKPNPILSAGAGIKAASSQSIVAPAGTIRMQVHFSHFDIDARNSGADDLFPDELRIYDQNNVLQATYNNVKPPEHNNEEGWSAPIAGGSISLRLSCGASGQSGYAVDQLRVSFYPNAYRIQSRLDVAKEAVTYTLNALQDKINWGFATFAYDETIPASPKGNGATFSFQESPASGVLSTLIDPAVSPGARQRMLAQALRLVEPRVFTRRPAGFRESTSGTYDITPLGEALQDVFKKGFFENRKRLAESLCRKNSVLVVTDGYPSGDSDRGRIAINGHTAVFDTNGHGFSQDPYQYAVPPDSYYDDVAAYLYTHSWLDNAAVSDPKNSYENAVTHQVSFGAAQPLLMAAAMDGGGQYLSAYNKAQLSSALYAVALQMAEPVTLTAPATSVNPVNKIQNGNDLYFTFFQPQTGKTWAGNLKKFQLGDGSGERPKILAIYDGANVEIPDGFIGTSKDMWSGQSGSADVAGDGAGPILLAKVRRDFMEKAYWNRNIYTAKGGAITRFTRETMSPADLAVADAATRDSLVNYIYGYTYEADLKGNPIGVRDWVLGSIIHSTPVVVDYYDPADSSRIAARYVAVGANDGMLHVFDDTPGSGRQGSEVFAFVPSDLLPGLQSLPFNDLIEMVDGSVTLYRKNNNPQYLIFGERRGGRYYWCLDISAPDPCRWTVKWQYTNPEIRQTWSDTRIASLPVKADPATGARTFQDVLIFSGGYDIEEDNYPEPFDDYDHTGTPYSRGGAIDPAKWSAEKPEQDVNGNGVYDMYNPGADSAGRGVFIVNIDDPSAVVTDGDGNTILPFQVTSGPAKAIDATVNAQTRSDMNFCIPASPSAVLGTSSYEYKDARTGQLKKGVKNNTLLAVYAADIYTNIFKITYNFDERIIKKAADPKNKAFWQWKSAGSWSVNTLFSGNPGSTRGSGSITRGMDNPGDQGRKTFASPTVSWGGSCLYFDKANYQFPNTVFNGTDQIASLFFGTGDREHPQFTFVRNRLYSLYDDSAVTAKVHDSHGNFLYDSTVSTAAYKENDLLNLTCSELGAGSIAGPEQRHALETYLTDDATRTETNGTIVLENGMEDDAKGWYIVLQDQGKCPVGSRADASTLDDGDNHDGEAILSEVVLYDGVVYFTSSQPAVHDPCNPRSNGFVYALDYCNAGPAYNLKMNDGARRELADRYTKYTGIYGLPSGVALVLKNGQAGLMTMLDNRLSGARPDTLEIKSPPFGLKYYYWRESNSRR